MTTLLAAQIAAYFLSHIAIFLIGRNHGYKAGRLLEQMKRERETGEKKVYIADITG